MPAAQYLVFRSGDSNCALPLDAVREIARYPVLTASDVNGDVTSARINAHGQIASVQFLDTAKFKNPALCIVTQLEPEVWTAFLADEILGVRADRGDARLLADYRAQNAA